MAVPYDPITKCFSIVDIIVVRSKNSAWPLLLDLFYTLKVIQDGRSDQLLVSAQKVFIDGEVWFQLPEPDPFLIFYVAEGLAPQVLIIEEYL